MVTAWPELGFRVSDLPPRIVLIISFSSLDSSLASWVRLSEEGSSSSSSLSEERLLMVSKRRSSRVWLRKGFGELRRFGGRIWSLPIRVWRRRLSKFGVAVLKEELLLMVMMMNLELGRVFSFWLRKKWGFSVCVRERDEVRNSH